MEIKKLSPKFAIRNAGESADVKVITLNKLFAKRTMKCFENPQYTYSNHCNQLIKKPQKIQCHFEEAQINYNTK